jgi:hypothetical protein
MDGKGSAAVKADMLFESVGKRELVAMAPVDRSEIVSELVRTFRMAWPAACPDASLRRLSSGSVSGCGSSSSMWSSGDLRQANGSGRSGCGECEEGASSGWRNIWWDSFALAGWRLFERLERRRVREEVLGLGCGGEW